MVKSRKRDSEDSEMEDVSKRQDDESDQGEGSEAGSEEPEYEIEAIVDAKHGIFPGGKLGYYVKWKGFSENDNSWVSEEDAANAQDLINLYWKEHPNKHKKPGPRRSDVKVKTSAVSKRKSPIVQEDEEEDAPPPPKKRGKQSKSVSEDEADEDEESEPVSQPVKKTKKSTGGNASAKKANSARKPELNDSEQFTNMKKWANAASWAHLVDHIETVERTDDNRLLVYFQLKDKSGKEKGLCRETSETCREKMPYMMLDFYENNLRWKSVV